MGSRSLAGGTDWTSLDTGTLASAGPRVALDSRALGLSSTTTGAKWWNTTSNTARGVSDGRRNVRSYSLEHLRFCRLRQSVRPFDIAFSERRSNPGEVSGMANGQAALQCRQYTYANTLGIVCTYTVKTVL